MKELDFDIEFKEDFLSAQKMQEFENYKKTNGYYDDMPDEIDFEEDMDFEEAMEEYNERYLSNFIHNELLDYGFEYEGKGFYKYCARESEGKYVRKFTLLNLEDKKIYYWTGDFDKNGKLIAKSELGEGVFWDVFKQLM